jgi:LPS-assembly lipoprotein
MPQSLRRIRLLSLLLALALLQGCGWHLRGTADLPSSVSPIHIEGPAAYDRFRMELAQALRNNGIQLAENRNEASSLLRILETQTDSRVLSVVPSTGKIAEIELHHEVQFTLLDTSGNELVPRQRIRVQRAYLNTEEEVLGKLREGEVLRKEMRQELAQKILRRLQSSLR